MYGADVSLLHSIQSLNPKAYYPIVILPADMPAGMLSAELDRLGVEYHVAHLGILRRKYLSLQRFLSLILEFTRGVAYVRSTVCKHNASIVYVNTIVSVSGAIGGRLAGLPVLWHVHEILSYPRPIRWILCQILSSCADRIVCVSSAVRESLIRENPSLADKSVVVYNAVPSEVGTFAGDGLELPLEIGVPPGTVIVGMVGRITHWKGQEILAEAAALVLKHLPDVHFVAVGSYFSDESHYLQKIESLITRLELGRRFHILEYRANVTAVYRALDIFVLPSIKPEPFGRVTVEAMKQGCAVIATNHGGTPELIQDGVTGILVPPSDPKALAEAIEMLLANPDLREKIGRAASDYAQINFGLPHYAIQMKQLLDGLGVDRNI